MSIVEKRKTELTSGIPSYIFEFPEIEDEINESVKVKDLKYKDLMHNYNDIQNKYSDERKRRIKIEKRLGIINFTLYCPEVNKEIEFNNCCESCSLKLCKSLYNCEKRLEGIKHYFKI